jgi:hypothetical protein
VAERGGLEEIDKMTTTMGVCITIIDTYTIIDTMYHNNRHNYMHTPYTDELHLHLTYRIRLYMTHTYTLHMTHTMKTHITYDTHLYMTHTHI